MKLSGAPDVEKLHKKRDVNGLIKALRHGDGADGEQGFVSAVVRRDAAVVLGDLSDPRAVEPLIEALGDGVWFVRVHAARSLGELGDSGAVEPLVAALGDEHPSVRTEAALALASLHDSRATGPLIESLGDEDLGSQRPRVRDALRRIGTPAAERALAADEGPVHISPLANDLRCHHCNEVQAASEWPERGDMVPFYYQAEPGRYTLTLTCSGCGKDWYVVWDEDPGPIKPLGL